MVRMMKNEEGARLGWRERRSGSGGVRGYGVLAEGGMEDELALTLACKRISWLHCLHPNSLRTSKSQWLFGCSKATSNYRL
jgi:hypothetical protein